MTATQQLARTPLADWHAAHGGRLVDFAGWAMPVHYDTGKGGSIVDEHVATRSAVGLFDVSHMGRLSIVGPRAAEFLDRVLTRRASNLKPGQIRYSLVCNESGGVLDDVLVGRGELDSAGVDYGLVVNASNREKLLDWFADHAIDGATVTDHTATNAMIAVQGPGAAALLAGLTDADLGSMRYYTSRMTVEVAGAPCSVSRTGYTGEDGFELIVRADQAEALWQKLVDGGGRPCGLASRDTLRLEAGMPLYGHELTDQLNPLHAGLAFAVDFDGADGEPRDFIGCGSLMKARDDGSLATRVGLKVEGRRPPREDYRVMVDGRPCGVVTSGTHSPTLGQPIAMAYVEPGLADPGTRLAIDVRGTETPAVVVALPFYKRPK